MQITNRRVLWNNSKRTRYNQGKKITSPNYNQYIHNPVSVSVQDKPVYNNINEFDDFPIHPSLKKQIEKRGYTIPTEIQDKSLHHTLNGLDLIGVAQTGTGKTGAFLIPIIQRLLENPKHFTSLIITPTRELALQVEEEFKKLAHGLNLTSTSLIGGTNLRQNVTDLKNGKHVVIGTPGRLVDMAKRRSLPLQNFSVLVLDEFDRMLDMGFSEDIDHLTHFMSNRNQTLLFSATTDSSQVETIKNLMKNPVEVKIQSENKSCISVTQNILKVPPGLRKIDLLLELIEEHKSEKVLLFSETKRGVKKIFEELKKAGIKAEEIHGDKPQHARKNALRKFSTGSVKVLIATDVAARGLDITDISLVINYEIPSHYDSYIHRVGRTGRAGKTGKAITFVN